LGSPFKPPFLGVIVNLWIELTLQGGRTMPIDWDEFENEIDEIIETSSTSTDERLASKISSITRMTDEEVQELFPEPADVKKLSELMKIVKSADDRNSKVNNIISNAEEFGGIILTLLSKFA
jgi:hypothetical protein